MLQGFEQGLQVNGETGRRVVRTITAQEVIVPSATTDPIAEVRGEALEGNTGVVMEPADIAEINEYPVFQPIGFEHIVHLGEIGQRCLGGSALTEIGRLMQYFRFPE